MKTQIALTLALFGLSLPAFSQGNFVIFENGGVTFPTLFADRFVYRDFVGGEKLVGTNYVAGLWYVLGNDPDAVDGRISPELGQHAGPLFPFRVATTVRPGTWVAINPQITLDGATYLDATMLQVRVWDAEKFSSYAEAFAAGESGASAPFFYLVPPSGASPQSYYMDNLRAFALNGQGQGLLADDLVVAEGSNGVVQANLKIRLTSAQPGIVSVDFATQDGTALAGQDYVGTNGTVVFAPGETTKIVPVTLTADAPAEDDEVFYLQLSNPVNAVLARARAACTITEIRIAGISFDTAVSFNTVLGHRYVVERTGNALIWEPVPGATNVAGTGEIVSIVDRGAGCQAMRAYRARLLED
jgi:hypothetical protein